MKNKILKKDTNITRLLLVLFISITTLFLTCSCTKDKVKPNDKLDDKPIVDETPKEEEKPEPYVDNNPITIGLYMDYVYYQTLLTEVTSPWIKNTDITILSVLPTNDKSVNQSNYYQYVWKSYWDKYTNIDDYKVGFHLKFTLNNEEIIEKTILSPNDTKDLYKYVQVYLYDDVHQPINTWYSHLEENDINEKTIISSIKLTASTYIDEVSSPIEVTVFTYNKEDDFEPETGKYRGKSNYTINVNRK